MLSQKRDSIFLIDNVHRDLLTVALCDSLNDGPDFLRDSALTADDLAHILRSYMELQDGAFFILSLGNTNCIGVIDKVLCHIQQKVLHDETLLQEITARQPS